MHKVASLLGRVSGRNSPAPETVPSESTTKLIDDVILRSKCNAFRGAVRRYVSKSSTDDADPFCAKIMELLSWFMEQPHFPISLESDLRAYLERALPLFTSIYRRYHDQIVHFYRHSFIATRRHHDDLLNHTKYVEEEDRGHRRHSKSSPMNAAAVALSIESPRTRSPSKSNELRSAPLDSLKAVSERSVEFVDTLYDLVAASYFSKIPISQRVEEMVPDLLSVIMALSDLSLSGGASSIWIWNDINLSLKLLTGICNHLCSETIAVLSTKEHSVCWNRWCHFIEFAVRNAAKQPKLWVLAERMLSRLHVLAQTDCDAVSRAVLRRKLLFYFKDIVYCLLAKSAAKWTQKTPRFVLSVFHRVCCSLFLSLSVFRPRSLSVSRSSRFWWFYSRDCTVRRCTIDSADSTD